MLQPSTWSDALSERVIQLRKQWLSFDEADEALVKEVNEIVDNNLDAMIEDMYAHFLSFEETRRFFPDEATLKRAQDAQKRYFARLCKGNYDRDYVAQRLAVGDTHYRIGLDPTWYMGAYNRVLTWMRRLVNEKFKDDHESYLKVISALTRLVFFDMGLAIESYSIAKEQAITRQQDAITALETERRVTKNILEDAPSGILHLDESLNCVECNQEFLAILDINDRDEVIGKRISDVAPFIVNDVFEEVLSTGHPYRKTAEFINLTKVRTAPPSYFDWAVWPVKDSNGQVYRLIAIFNDATNRVLLQQQREDFVATLTHDLKTPILAANRAIKLLMEGDFGSVEDSQKRVLETILQSNDAMYKMVQTLLDVYRYDSGMKKLALGEHDLSDAISRMVAELTPLATSRGVTLDAQLPPAVTPVQCDIGEIRRVIQNLLDNALKFTPSGGKIQVILEQFDPVSKITVSDTGKGISVEDKPKLFQRFWAAASSGRYYASTGLGLYLCRKIVELHGGTISVESEVGKGSTFWFTINPPEAKRGDTDGPETGP